MDWEAFERDVWNSVNESTYDGQRGDIQTDEFVVTIGETWQGTLYGAEENTYGQRYVYMFDNEDEQLDWFNDVTQSFNNGAECNCTDPYCQV